MRSLIPLWILALFGGATPACGSDFADPGFAAAAATQGHAGGPWASAACSLDDGSTCRILCAQRVANACNNAGVIDELQGDLAGANAANALYSLACGKGSAGACYNRDRFAPVAEERARRSTGPASEPPQDPTRVEFASPDSGLTAVPDILRGHAADFIPCPREKLSVQQLRSAPNPWFSSFLVDGCGKRVAYGLCQIGASGTECYTVTSFFSLPTGSTSQALSVPAPSSSGQPPSPAPTAR